MSAECFSCKGELPVEDAVKCCDCSYNYHYHCAQVKEIIFRKKSAQEKSLWCCPNCRSSRGKSPSTTPQFPDFRAFIDEIKTEFKKGMDDMSAKFEQLKVSQEFLSEKYDAIIVKLDGLSAVNKKVEKLNTIISKQEVMIQDLQLRVQSLEQYSRRSHLEIAGFEEVQGENVEEIVKTVGAKLNVTIKNEDIQAAHRILSKAKPSPIIVEFSSRKIRDDFLFSKYKKTAVDGKNNKIYIRESLSPFFKNLLWQSKQIAKEAKFEFCWFKKNKIHIKQTGKSSNIFTIEKFSDLVTFCKQNNLTHVLTEMGI